MENFRKAPLVAAFALLLAGCTTGSDVTRMVNPHRFSLIAVADELTQKFMREVPYKVTFEDPNWELSETTRLRLIAQARWIKEHQEAKVQVLGDASAAESLSVALELAEMQAAEVVDFLKAQGVAPGRIELIVSPVSLSATFGGPGPEEEVSQVVTLVYGHEEDAAPEERERKTRVAETPKKKKPGRDNEDDDERCPRLVMVCLD